MSEEELKKLKEEIKKEVVNELTSKKIAKEVTWDKLKKEFKKMFYSKGYTDREQYWIFSAISVILRLSLGYNRLCYIPSEKEEEARQIMFKILNIFPNKTTTQ